MSPRGRATPAAAIGAIAGGPGRRRSRFPFLDFLPVFLEGLPGGSARSTSEATEECLAYPPLEPGARLLGYRFSRVEFRTDRGPIDAEHSSVLIDDLAQEVVVEATGRGRIEAFYFPRFMRPSARSHMKAILNATQIVLPPGAERRWETVETDMTGRYRARYLAEVQPAGHVVIKKLKESYQSVHTYEDGVRRTAGAGARVIPTGIAEAVVEVDDGALVSMRLKAQLEIRDSGPRDGIRVQTDAYLRRRSRTRDRSAAELTRREISRRLSGMDPSGPDGTDESALLGDSTSPPQVGETAGRRSVSELASDLSRLLESGGGTRRDAWELVRGLADLIARDEANARTVGDLIRGGKLAGASANYLAGALGNAGTPAAQAALADLLLEPGFDPGLRSSCLVAFAAVKEPSERAERALRALADETDEFGVNVNALLLLGVMADRLREGDPDRRSEIARFVMDREERLRNEGRLKIFLEALGNAGVDACFPAIERYIYDPDVSTRAAAIAALRKIEHAGIDGQLRDALHDPEAPVRLAAIEAMRARPPSPELAEVVGKTALLAPEARVRRAAVIYLGDRIDDPASRKILELVATDDRDEGLRRLAGDLLSDA